MTSAECRVLVTGGSGFLGSHTILRLLDAGHTVRTTVRSPDRQATVRAMLQGAGADVARLTFAVADLTRNAGWAAAAAGCTYLVHVASPFPSTQPKDEGELIGPAVDGSLRVLRAARDAGVRRVVMTSSFAAIGYSPKAAGAPYDETDWTDPDHQANSYVKSKTLAERAAWDFAGAHPDGPELTVINPVGIFGPALGSDYASSVGLIKALLDGKPPILARASFALVDVRDVADLHVRAMTAAAAAGHRFLAAAGQPMTMPEIAAILRSELGDDAAAVPTTVAPDWMVRLGARLVPQLATLAGLLGSPKLISTAKVTNILGWQPYPVSQTILDTGRSLVAAPRRVG
jgi:nucleoside-diphosphate-sugar epimerase